MSKSKKWEKFELLAKEIQEQLSPDATVEHNVRMLGKSMCLYVCKSVSVFVEQASKFQQLKSFLHSYLKHQQICFTPLMMFRAVMFLHFQFRKQKNRS